ncbi:MAG TPA: glutamine-hydrolyzing GMP synthase [Planctomycetota bacterium]|nr:glutamine-hydrolyzing GMP synthase [Planctomycetota bacterium]
MARKTDHQLVLILDFGSQYAQLIARRVREFNCYSQIRPYTIGLDEIRRLAPAAVIFTGGPRSVYDRGAPLLPREYFDLGIPTLGICYGVQMATHVLGGRVEKARAREFGRTELKVKAAGCLFDGLRKRNTVVWMSHGDRLERLPKGFRVLAQTKDAPAAAVADEQRRFWGVQFHPEVSHTEQGRLFLRNFLKKCAGLKGDWTVKSFIEESVAGIRERVGSHRVVLGLSGGVDSAVAALLIHRAIGAQLECIFVDNGVLRRDEFKRVKDTFGKDFGPHLHAIDAADRFLKELAGVTDPEKKRKVIGRVFVEVFEEEARKLKGVKFLAQGTLYPDVIESVAAHGGPTAVIKSHHNVGGLPARMGLELLEPLRLLFKDEVRVLGRELGLPDGIVNRQPFPGPGLAVRILGEVTRERADVLRAADWIVVEEMKKSGWYDKLWQTFAVLLPVKTVGVMGDERTYENALVLRCVDSADGMTADWVRLPYELLATISNRIINEVRGVNRVVYDLTSKPPGTIEWE